MRKILFALFLSFLIFVILNFLYSNLDQETFNYQMQFEFRIPYLVTIKSIPMPLGFILITSFCLGIVFLAVLQALPSLFRGLAVRSRDRRIRALELEIEEMRRVEGPVTSEVGPPGD
jgi:hypothetical protein